MSVFEVIERLPDVRDVKRVSRALAVLDLVLNEDGDSNYFSFDARWSETEEAALMRDGSGNEYSIVFSADGAFGYGFDHESAMSPYVNDGRPWPGLIDGVPEVFQHARDDKAFWDPIGAPRAGLPSGVRRPTRSGDVVRSKVSTRTARTSSSRCSRTVARRPT